MWVSKIRKDKTPLKLISYNGPSQSEQKLTRKIFKSRSKVQSWIAFLLITNFSAQIKTSKVSEGISPFRKKVFCLSRSSQIQETQVKSLIISYDSENPPPKVIQGYKFNIFYPDLADKTTTPQFYLEPNATPDTLNIRFHAGAPYEDIAFTIINREWEMSERHGFRSSFDRGILQLHFNFKRHRYRRWLN